MIFRYSIKLIRRWSFFDDMNLLCLFNMKLPAFTIQKAPTTNIEVILMRNRWSSYGEQFNIL